MRLSQALNGSTTAMATPSDFEEAQVFLERRHDLGVLVWCQNCGRVAVKRDQHTWAPGKSGLRDGP